MRRIGAHLAALSPGRENRFAAGAGVESRRPVRESSETGSSLAGGADDGHVEVACRRELGRQGYTDDKIGIETRRRGLRERWGQAERAVLFGPVDGQVHHAGQSDPTRKTGVGDGLDEIRARKASDSSIEVDRTERFSARTCKAGYGDGRMDMETRRPA
jgi:hypothetical protein